MYLIQAIIIGILTIIVGNIIGIILKYTSLSINLPKECMKWNTNNIMEISLFVTGIVVYILVDKLNINKKIKIL